MSSQKERKKKSIPASDELWQNIEFVDGFSFFHSLQSRWEIFLHADQIENTFVQHAATAAVAVIKWNKYKPEAIRSHNLDEEKKTIHLHWKNENDGRKKA